jgi:nucleotide-binding universal stress UspA family protein
MGGSIMIKKILVAYDGGSQSNKALEAAIEIAGNTGAEIFIASAYTIPVVYQGSVPSGEIFPDNSVIINYLYENTHNHLVKILKEAAEKVRQANIAVHTEILEGSPGKVVTQFAEDKKIDLIITGSQNRTTVNRLFMGSVSNYILHHAKCLVLVAKDV